MENKEALRKELAEEIEAASLLLDDRLYTTKSYYNLVTAIGYGKAVLAREDSSAETIEEAIRGIHTAVDEMKLQKRGLRKELTPVQAKKRTTLLLAGAFFGGLLLGKYALRKEKKKEKKQK